MVKFYVNTGKFYFNTGKSPIFTRKKLRELSLSFLYSRIYVNMGIQKFNKIDAWRQFHKNSQIRVSML